MSNLWKCNDEANTQHFWRALCHELFQGFASNEAPLWKLFSQSSSQFSFHRRAINRRAGWEWIKTSEQIQWAQINNGEVIYDFIPQKMFLFFFRLYCRLISLIYLSSRQNKCSAISFFFFFFFTLVEMTKKFFLFGIFIMMKAFLVGAK